MELNIDNIVSSFGYKLKENRKIRSSYRCKTDKGIKELKKLDVSPEKIFLAHESQEHLRSKGFENVDRFSITEEGNPFLKTEDDEYYIIRDWHDNKEMALEDDNEVRLATESLARLHIASKGFESSEKSFVRDDLGDLDSTYERRTRELVKMKRKIAKDFKWDKFDKLFTSNFNYYYAKALESLENLRDSNYYNIVEKTKNEKSFCHHEYAYHNIVFDKNNKLIIRDFENSCYEIRMYDLANLIKRYMRKSNWNILKTERMIKIYNNISKISHSELKILYSMLSFPQKFWRVSNRHYNSRRVLADANNLNQLKAVISQQNQHEKYIKDFRRLII